MEEGRKPAGSLAALVLLAVALTGCGSLQEQLKDADRSYTGFADISTGMAGAEMRWTPAATPGQGKPSVGLRLQGQIPVGTQLSPDFKSGPRATTKGIWF